MEKAGKILPHSSWLKLKKFQQIDSLENELFPNKILYFSLKLNMHVMIIVLWGILNHNMKFPAKIWREKLENSFFPSLGHLNRFPASFFNIFSQVCQRFTSFKDQNLISQEIKHISCIPSEISSKFLNEKLWNSSSPSLGQNRNFQQ